MCPLRLWLVIVIFIILNANLYNNCAFIINVQSMQNYIISVNMDNVMDKSMRSVFVGNIPYEVTDDKLKEPITHRKRPIHWY